MDNSEKELFTASKEVRLLRSEKEVMRSRIFAMPPVPSRRPLFWFIQVTRFAFVALAGLLVVSLPLAYAAQRSMPGDVLYGLELSVIEPIERVTQFSPKSRLAYSVDRLEERLQEVQTVSDEIVATKKIVAAHENVRIQVKTVLDSLSQEDEREDTVEQLVKISAVLAAYEERLSEADEKDLIIEELTDTVTEELLEKVEEYAHEQNDEELLEIVRQELLEVGELTEDHSTSSTRSVAVQDDLEHAGASVEQGDLEEALQGVIDAKVKALTEDYTERGDDKTVNDKEVKDVIEETEEDEDAIKAEAKEEAGLTLPKEKTTRQFLGEE